MAYGLLDPAIGLVGVSGVVAEGVVKYEAG